MVRKDGWAVNTASTSFCGFWFSSFGFWDWEFDWEFDWEGCRTTRVCSKSLARKTAC